MKRQIEVTTTSNMKDVTWEIEANLWEKNGLRRWYVGDERNGKLCFDADTQEQIKVHKQINNPSIVSQVKKALFG